MTKLYPITSQKWLLFLSVLFLSLRGFAQPVIHSFSPATGPVGTPVTLTGSGFSTTPANNIVFFGAVKAAVTAAAAGSLTVTVPAGATFMPITVTVNRQTAYSTNPFVVTFPGGGVFTVGTFAERDTLISPLYPYAVEITDLDSDGRPDLAAVSNSNVPASYLSVYRNTSTGAALSFSTKKDFTLPGVPYDMAAGDLDGDGKPELAVSYLSNGGNVAIYKNTSTPGTLSLAAPVTCATGSGPYKVSISDIDKDGKPDLVTSNYLAGTISVLRNTSTAGAISFAPKMDILTNPMAYSISIADFDGDGKPDIATTAEQDYLVSIHKNTSSPGAISFATKMDLPARGHTVGLSAGDVDGDGKADLAVRQDDGLSIYRNISGPGSIAFDLPVNHMFMVNTAGPWDVKIGDLSGDAVPEIVIASPEGNKVTVMKNYSSPGTISLAPEQDYFAYYAFRVDIGDLNGDGRPEIVVPNFISNIISVFENSINEPYVTSFDPLEGEEGDTITIYGANFPGVTAVSFGGVPASSFTMNANGTIAAVLGKGASGQVVVTNAYGTSKADGFIFHAPPLITSFTPSAGKTGDTITIKGTSFEGATAVSIGGVPAASFTVNSSTSIAAVVAAGASGSISVTTQYGAGALAGFTYYPPPVITSFTPAAGDRGTVITIAGANFTGTSSVLVGGAPVSSFTVQSASTITAVVNEGGTGSVSVTARGGTAASSGKFSFPPPTIISFSPQTGPQGTVVTITGTNFRSEASANHVYFGAVKATVKTATRTALTVVAPVGTTYQPLTVTVNNHTAFADKPFNMTYPGGDPEITATSFPWKAVGNTEGGARRVLLADIDSDGKSDIVYYGGATGVVGVMRNSSTTGVVSFAPHEDLAIASSPRYLDIGDLNGDGKLEIIIGDAFGRIFIWRNTSTPGKISFDPKWRLPQNVGYANLLIIDVDGDAKTDIVCNDDTTSASLAVLRNTGNDGNLSFAPRMDIAFHAPEGAGHLRSGDFDSDGKPDVAILTNDDIVKILRNSSTPGNISFTEVSSFGPLDYTTGMCVADFDNDHKMDLAIVSENGNSSVIYRNTGTAGNITFAPALTFGTGTRQSAVTAGQIDGDELPDIVTTSDGKGLLVYHNTSSPGAISLAQPAYLVTRVDFNFVEESAIGDVDGDGKADIATSNDYNSFISIFRNQQNEKIATVCSTTDTTLTADITGTRYQWQVNTGSGYTNVTDNADYAGAATASLHLKAVPESWNWYQYRCVTDGVTGKAFNLVVRPTIIQGGTISSPARVCLGYDYYITYETTYIAHGSTLELWRSINGGEFSLVYGDTYYGNPTRLTLPKDTVAGVKRYFVVTKPPATLPCTAATHSDTTTTLVEAFEAPVVTAVGINLTVSNPDPGTLYTWQVFTLNGNWSDIDPYTTGSEYYVRRVGQYRVRANRLYCDYTRYSDAQDVVITAIDPVTAESAGIKLFPNPVTVSLAIRPLKLSDKWQTLDIYRADGQLVVSGYDIRNQTAVTMNTEHLVSGAYTALLRRKDGPPVAIKFIKQ